jgi:hypothetical protein
MAGDKRDKKDYIRAATYDDIDAIVEIYMQCFPERVKEIFGGAHRRIFLRDYLLFSLSLDPMNNWVSIQDGAVVGFIMAPCHYSQWRAMFSRWQLLRWVGHFLTGQYGFPAYLIRGFFRGGFTFDSDPAIKRLWGKPYIHLDAVKATEQREPSKGLLGVGRQLMRWAIAEHRKRGVNFCWGIVQPTASQYLPIWKRVGFKVSPISHGRWLILLGEPDEK